MKKKYILPIMPIILATLLMLLSGCVSTLGVLPYGVWQSEEPYILLDIPYEGTGMYTGKCEKGGEIIDIVFGIPVSHKGITIFDAIALESNEFSSKNMYYAGTYTYTEDKLVYKLSPYFQEIHGIKKITFTKIQDYEPEPRE